MSQETTTQTKRHHQIRTGLTNAPKEKLSGKQDEQPNIVNKGPAPDNLEPPSETEDDSYK